jgi:D-aspartate ligase
MMPRDVALPNEDRRPPAVVMGDLTIVRPLGRGGVRSIVVTDERDDVTLRSRYAAGSCIIGGFSRAEHSRTLEALLDLAQRLQRTRSGKLPLFYGNDAQLEFIDAHREQLAESFAFLLNQEELSAALRDKERFHERARSLAIPVPATAPGERRDEIERLRAPLLVKPREKADCKDVKRDLFGGSGKARAYASHRELWSDAAFARHAGAVIVQECIGGDTRDLESFHGFASERGLLLGQFTGRKIRTFPGFAGESSFIELTDDADVAAFGSDVARRLGLRGVFKIDLIRDPRDGNRYVLEVNARFNLWNYLGAVHGVNLPLVAYEYLMEGRESSCSPAVAPLYRWLHFYRDALAYRERRREGLVTLPGWIASLASRRIVYDVFAWNDPAPFACWMGEYLRRKVVT